MGKAIEELIKAEQLAIELFAEVERRNLIVAGKTEKELNTEIYILAKDLFGIEKYWHKRIVRSGANTLKPYKENPPNLIIQQDDILFFDFGPIIESWEADLGRTYVLGTDKKKLKLKSDVELAWQETKNWFEKQDTLKASDLFAYTVQKAEQYGWSFGGPIAGHLIGEFPHEKLDPDNYMFYIHPENDTSLFDLDENGNRRHWILELHFVDQKEKIGAFYEQLLF